MPIRVVTATHRANAIDRRKVKRCATSALDVLNVLLPKDKRSKPFQIIQTSWDSDKFPSALEPASNGLVSAIFQAYSYHHHLHIRPEDMWFAILTQFSFYVNAHAEELRDQFVSHKGQEDLVLGYGSLGRRQFDFRIFAKDMNRKIQQNIIDPELREWIIPNFTTTQLEDEVMASIIMMGTTQNYFKFECVLGCGIPSVTLLGEKKDYEKILGRLEKLEQYGTEPTLFAALLRPVLDRVIRSFDDPSDPMVLEFWQTIFSARQQGSGSTSYNGWVTAFCFWEEEGNLLYRLPDSNHRNQCLDLDGMLYSGIASDKVPGGWINVPVKVDDHGEVVDSEMLAGSIGVRCFGKNGRHGSDRVLDTMQPETGWWIIEKDPGLAAFEKELKWRKEKLETEWSAQAQRPRTPTPTPTPAPPATIRGSTVDIKPVSKTGRARLKGLLRRILCE